MEFLLRNLFLTEYGEESYFLPEMSTECIWNAGVIITKLFSGESLTCKPEFRYRNRGIVIGLIDSVHKSFGRRLLCYRDMVFISRHSSIEHIYSNVVQAWNQRRQSAHYPPDYSCSNCRPEHASPRELAIAFELMSSTSVAETARKLHISEKTVYAHKYSLMKKFQISNKKEFCNLLNYFKGREAIDVP